MRRRAFIRYAGTVAIGLAMAPAALAKALTRPSHQPPPPPIQSTSVTDYLAKMRHFNSPHSDDIYLDEPRRRLLDATLNRLKRLQRCVGFSNFYLIDFDEALALARGFSTVGAFSKQELGLMEMLFYEDGARYGFFGEKPIKQITQGIAKDKVEEVPGTDNFVFKGAALELYRKMQKDVGQELILTSGVRGIVKQFILFMNKASNNGGNLSLASRSLAPPGYSFHGVGDFDVGQAGFGAANFTDRFAESAVFQKLMDSGYVNLRYQLDNLLGVRFEPWHIKVN